MALSLSGPLVEQTQTVGVTHHRALWSPDFPPRHVPRLKPSGRSVSLPPWSFSRSAPAIIAPATNSLDYIQPGVCARPAVTGRWGSVVRLCDAASLQPGRPGPPRSGPRRLVRPSAWIAAVAQEGFGSRTNFLAGSESFLDLAVRAVGEAQDHVAPFDLAIGAFTATWSVSP